MAFVVIAGSFSEDLMRIAIYVLLIVAGEEHLPAMLIFLGTLTNVKMKKKMS